MRIIEGERPFLGTTEYRKEGRDYYKCCTECGSTQSVINGDSELVCTDCGLVLQDSHHHLVVTANHIKENISRGFQPINNYCTLYLFNQVMRRYHLQQSPIPEDDISLIKETCDELGLTERYTKEQLYRVFRILDMTKYQKRWIQVRYQIQGHRPTPLGLELIEKMHSCIKAMQNSFSSIRETFQWEKGYRLIFPPVTFIVRMLLVVFGCWKKEHEEYFPESSNQKTRTRQRIIFYRTAKHCGIWKPNPVASRAPRMDPANQKDNTVPLLTVKNPAAKLVQSTVLNFVKRGVKRKRSSPS